ncbi:unnamed protein product [Vicia faba]|uniref:Integrase zinc-binding domain-containing protein n=1 Tax=Vicia faba TaxID=3906 RepID=A0AAV1B3D0_VICFA|nr:unnamed protein product [Vicia faba]
MKKWPIPTTVKQLRDALSRVPAEWPEDSVTNSPAFQALVSQPTFSIIQQLQNENTTDPFLVELHNKQLMGTLSYPFSVVHGLVVHKGRYVLGPTSRLCLSIISEFHDTPSGGHAGVKRTLARIAANFFLA